MNTDSVASTGALSPSTGILTASTEVSTEGQVCDRCRQKKIKCDGSLPACGSCMNAQVICVTSATLRRRTTARGYKPSTSVQIDTLRNENADLHRQLEVERASVALLNSRLGEAVMNAPSLSASHNMASERPEVSASYSASAQAKTIPALLIKHMGRLVQDCSGVDRFAGTTTGVHFVLLVQQAVRSKYPYGDFPEGSFKLHMLDWVNQKTFLPIIGPSTPIRPTVTELFRRPLAYYSDQMAFFTRIWSCLCPLVEPTDLAPRLQEAINRAQNMAWPFLENRDLALFQVALIIMINSTIATDDEIDTASVEELSRYFDAVAATASNLISRADIFGLHSIALLSFYILLTGQHQSMPCISGIMVQCAFSLGLHRHGRRFKYSPRENELRKRLWWWIYIFDKMTAIVHGLPTLIHDNDVDIDYPLDCDLGHGDIPNITLPLPGESTPVNDFIAFIHLGRLLSTILDQLYTTTSRRNGPEKIVNLRNELLGWNQKFVGQLDGRIDSDGLIRLRIGHRRDLHDDPFSRVLLPSLSNMAIMLIHRPGLTFSETTPEFHESLRWCASSSSAIIEDTFTIYSNPRMCRIVFPLSPNTIFQSAMLHIFLWFQQSPQDKIPGISRNSSLDKIKMAADILSKHPFMDSTEDSWHWRTPEYSAYALCECLNLLQSLSSLIIYSASIGLDDGPLIPGLWSDQTLDVISGGSSQDFRSPEVALYDLNHLDYMDPLLESTMAQIPHST
ncbi:fungal-specific transcription factor domain-containing protein [Xylaria arbuscula]|nr:fungal-specific transcription factor domain-containing protein [Xylaria arbuscula]